MAGRKDTDVTEDLVRQYLKEIGTYQLLTAEDEVTLGKLVDAGQDAERLLAKAQDDGVRLDVATRRQLDRAAREGRDAKARFIQCNLRLVVSIAKRYQSSGLPLLDLVQEGNLGLIRAVEKFDHRKGFKFSTYATWWIRQSITRAIADKGRTIRVPVHMVEIGARVTKCTNALTRSLGREPTIAEIAKEADLTPEKVLEIQRVGPDPVSLFEHVGDDDAELADFLADPNADVPFDVAVASLQREEMRTVLGTLSQREQRVLELRYGLVSGQPRTLEEVGREFRLTRERIRQIEAKALSKLRHPSTPPALREMAHT